MSGTIGRRLAALEQRRTEAALRDLRATMAAFHAVNDRWHETPGAQARAEALAREADAVRSPEQRAQAEAQIAALVEALPTLEAPYSTPEEIGRAVRLLEPLVTPRGSPPYVIVGAIKRLFVTWTAREREDLAAHEAERAGLEAKG